MDCSAAPAQNISATTHKKDFFAKNRRHSTCGVFVRRTAIGASIKQMPPMKGTTAQAADTIRQFEMPHTLKTIVDTMTTKMKPQQ
jgi:hypothetical protein